MKFVIRQAVQGKIEVGAYKKPLAKGSPEEEGGWLEVGANLATNSPMIIPRQAHSEHSLHFSTFDSQCDVQESSTS